jgi:predicted DNA-binding protein
MHTLTRTPTTEMEVTSIRLERELKEKLKELSGNQGYQALIRDILWNYIQQRSGEYVPSIAQTDIRATVNATAQQEEQCALTGKLLRPGEAILLGVTTNGVMVPLSLDSFGGVRT